MALNQRRRRTTGLAVAAVATATPLALSWVSPANGRAGAAALRGVEISSVQPPVAAEHGRSLSGASASCGAVLAAGATAVAATVGGTRKARGRVPRQFFGGGDDKPSGGNIYGYTVKDIDGADCTLSKFDGKVVLIVNVASEWGLTASNYAELCDLYSKYADRGLEILAFPCNQFGGQEPGTNEEIKAFAQGKCSKCFPLFDKIDVNGDAESPLWTFLKAEQGNGVLPSDIVWNFTKFLVNRKGEVVKRFNPQESPSSFENDIVDLL